MENLEVKHFTFEQWKPLYEDAFRAVFKCDPLWERFDFALMVVDSKNTPLHYYTVSASSPEICTILFGGAFPDFRGKGESFSVMKTVVNYLRNQFKFIRFTCERDNVAMLKFSLYCGFKIVGMGHYGGKMYIDHELGE